MAAKFNFPVFNFNRGLSVVAVAYLIIFGGLLFFSHGLPYVMDNNESFSAFVHGYNMFHFDWGRSFGLTDEASSPYASAHPVIHPHQGDWPRVFTFLLYSIGVRSVEGQILVATFTVGAASIWLAYRYFAKKVSPAFATLFCVILMTDYVLFTQWHANSYRVWYSLLFFAPFNLVEDLRGPRTRLATVLLLLHHIALFYFELVFASFVAVMTGLYAVWIHRKRLLMVLRIWSVQMLGGAIALATLIGQLTMFMGWENLVKDLTFTLHARSFATNPEELMRALRPFYDQLHVAVFYNLVDGETFHTLQSFFSSFLEFGLELHTAQLALVVLLVCFGWWLGAWSNLSGVSPVGEHEAPGHVSIVSLYSTGTAVLLWVLQGFLSGIEAAVAIAAASILLLIVLKKDKTGVTLRGAISILMPPLAVFLSEILESGGYAGVPLHPFNMGAVSLLLLLLMAAVVASGILLIGAHDLRIKVSLRRLIAATVLVVIATSLYGSSDLLYNQLFAPLWKDQALLHLGGIGWGAISVAALILAAGMSMRGTLAVSEVFARLKPLGPFLFTSMAGYCFAYVAVTGYVMSGYLRRYSPFHIFMLDVFVAAAFFIIGQMVKVSFADAERKLKSKITGIVSLVLLAVMVMQWGKAQWTWFQLMPPNLFEFTDLLKGVGENEGIISNNYALPFALKGNTWAYYDPNIDREDLKLGPNGYSLPFDTRYLWLADKDVNPVYKYPGYFICFYNVSLDLARFEIPSVSDKMKPTLCSSIPIVKAALNPEGSLMHPQLIARDEKWDRWAVIRMDWDFPPYLESIGGVNASRVSVSTELGSIHVKYIYRQQAEVPENYTTIDLFSVRKTGGRCYVAKTPLVSMQTVNGVASIPMKNSDVGRFVIGVTPVSNSKKGAMYWSDVYERVDSGKMTKTSCALEQEVTLSAGER